MGGTASRPQTRPATPFNPSFSVPATPPDLYLVTRNSPNLSQAIWENFQPDQLFPESANAPLLQQLSPSQPPQSLDQQMMAQMQQNQGMQGQQPMDGGGQNPYGQAMPKRGMGGSPMQPNAMLQPGMTGSFPGQQGGPNMWHGFEAPMVDGQSPSDSWSTGSVQGQPVPATLNVEDWFQFFGIQNDPGNPMNLDNLPML